MPRVTGVIRVRSEHDATVNEVLVAYFLFFALHCSSRNFFVAVITWLNSLSRFSFASLPLCSHWSLVPEFFCKQLSRRYWTVFLNNKNKTTMKTSSDQISASRPPHETWKPSAESDAWWSHREALITSFVSQSLLPLRKKVFNINFKSHQAEKLPKDSWYDD